MHDFKIKELGKVAPYGIYDVGQNSGWVNVGTDHDTAAFAVESIRRWGRMMGQSEYPQTRRLLITADAGGRNGVRVKLWKVELQKLADETRSSDLGVPLSTGHQQVEQDRAPAVFFHHPELAWQTAHQPRGDRQPDCCHDEQRRASRGHATRHQRLPKGDQSIQR